MNKRDQLRMTRLERENATLREQLDRAMSAYRENLYELVDVKAKLEMIADVMGMGRNDER